MKFTHRIVTFLQQRLAMAFAVFFLCSAAAAGAAEDPPGRVGRLSDFSGQVWFYSPDAGEWITAQRNRPLTTGDRLSTDTDARAELRIGSTSVRLDSGTELEILGIDDEHIALQLHNGSIATRLRSLESAREFELRTAEGRITTNRAGRYRFDRQDENTHVTVWSGEALYEGPGSALTVYAGQRAEFWLQGSAAQYSLTQPVHDNFASWSADRDRSEERSASSRYVSPEMTGAEDLDRYGRWEETPDYGTVWIPRHVPRGWAPYGAGHWTWVSPWGWTWVDDMPWGFAPFHYGRWAWFRSSWCWVPGAYVRRPVYAPALVGWVGGPHLSVSIAVGSRRAPGVGWFPLAPREVYVPSYRVTPGYVKQVNVTHVTNITNVTTIVNNPQNAVTQVDYRNRRHPHAVTVVPQEVMTSRRPVAPVASQLRATSVVQQLVNQPGHNVVVSAPPVAAPVLAPAAREQRRMRIHEVAPSRAAAVAETTAPPPVIVPPSPLQRSAPIVREREAGQRDEQERRRDDWRDRRGNPDRRDDDRRDGREARDDRPDVPSIQVPQRAAVTPPPTAPLQAAPAAPVHPSPAAQVQTPPAAHAQERSPRMRVPVPAPDAPAAPPVRPAVPVHSDTQPAAAAAAPRPPVMASPIARPAPEVVQRTHASPSPSRQRAAPEAPPVHAPAVVMPSPPVPSPRAAAIPVPPAEARVRSHDMPQARQPEARAERREWSRESRESREGREGRDRQQVR